MKLSMAIIGMLMLFGLASVLETEAMDGKDKGKAVMGSSSNQPSVQDEGSSTEGDWNFGRQTQIADHNTNANPQHQAPSERGETQTQDMLTQLLLPVTSKQSSLQPSQLVLQNRGARQIDGSANFPLLESGNRIPGTSRNVNPNPSHGPVPPNPSYADSSQVRNLFNYQPRLGAIVPLKPSGERIEGSANLRLLRPRNRIPDTSTNFNPNPSHGPPLNPSSTVYSWNPILSNRALGYMPQNRGRLSRNLGAQLLTEDQGTNANANPQHQRPADNWQQLRNLVSNSFGPFGISKKMSQPVPQNDREKQTEDFPDKLEVGGQAGATGQGRNPYHQFPKYEIVPQNPPHEGPSSTPDKATQRLQPASLKRQETFRYSPYQRQIPRLSTNINLQNRSHGLVASNPPHAGSSWIPNISNQSPQPPNPNIGPPSPGGSYGDSSATPIIPTQRPGKSIDLNKSTSDSSRTLEDDNQVSGAKKND